MKPLEIKTSSWHYKLVKKLALFDIRYHQKWEYGDGGRNVLKQTPVSICDYYPCVILGLIVAAFILCGGAFLATVLLSGLVGVFYLFIGHHISPLIGAGMIIDTMIAVFGACYGIARLIRYYRKKHTPKPPGFVKTAYKAWHDKICIPIEFKE